MTTMLYPPEWETIITNEPITAKEFLELYRPAREFVSVYSEFCFVWEDRDLPLFSSGEDVLDDFVRYVLTPVVAKTHPRLPGISNRYSTGIGFSDWKLVYEVIEAVTKSDFGIGFSVTPVIDEDIA